MYKLVIVALAVIGCATAKPQYSPVAYTPSLNYAYSAPVAYTAQYTAPAAFAPASSIGHVASYAPANGAYVTAPAVVPVAPVAQVAPVTAVAQPFAQNYSAYAAPAQFAYSGYAQGSYPSSYGSFPASYTSYPSAYGSYPTGSGSYPYFYGSYPYSYGSYPIITKKK